MKIVLSSHIPEITPAIIREVGKVVKGTALSIERNAKLAAPVDTGALRASIHTVTWTQNGYPDSAMAASGLNPKAVIFDPLPKPKPLQALVAVAVDYGEFLEMGTARQNAQPYLTPAAEGARAGFITNLSAAIKRATEGEAI